MNHRSSKTTPIHELSTLNVSVLDFSREVLFLPFPRFFAVAILASFGSFYSA
jgi:hypothetical protein